MSTRDELEVSWSAEAEEEEEEEEEEVEGLPHLIPLDTSPRSGSLNSPPESPTSIFLDSLSLFNHF